MELERQYLLPQVKQPRAVSVSEFEAARWLIGVWRYRGHWAEQTE